MDPRLDPRDVAGPGGYPEPGRRTSGITARGVAIAVAGAVVAALVVAWLYPSGDYLFVPNRAQPVAERVQVPGEKPRTSAAGIYFVDVTVRQANLLEKLFPAARPEGASLVDERDVVPDGSSFEQEHATALAEMSRSEQVASAVALRAAGYQVRTVARGVLVDGVFRDVPAHGTLRSGDVIVSVAGRPVRTLAHLRTEMKKVKAGEAVVLDLRRDKTTTQVTVRTTHDPSDAARAVIGILPAQDAEIDLPVKIEIDLDDVGGPSAGLPFALDVLQELGTEIAPGYRVAATGEIEIDGSVRPVGGLKQKTYGVREAEADVFLVPAGDNAVEARRYAGNLRVIPVENFQQALRALRTLPAK